MHSFQRNPPVARGPLDDPDDIDEGDEQMPPAMNDDDWEALIPDDDYEPLPEYGDFWPETD
jgi:hypothetical protein